MSEELYTKSAEYRKEYYQNNKDRILETMNRPKWCEFCEKNVRFCCWSKHCKGKKHQALEKKHKQEDPESITSRINELKALVESLESKLSK